MEENEKQNDAGVIAHPLRLKIYLVNIHPKLRRKA